MTASSLYLSNLTTSATNGVISMEIQFAWAMFVNLGSNFIVISNQFMAYVVSACCQCMEPLIWKLFICKIIVSTKISKNIRIHSWAKLIHSLDEIISTRLQLVHCQSCLCKWCYCIQYNSIVTRNWQDWPSPDTPFDRKIDKRICSREICSVSPYLSIGMV